MEADSGSAQINRADMSAYGTAEPTSGTPRAAGAGRPYQAAAGWLVSPAFDLLFLANLWWVLASWPGWLQSTGTSSLEFWQVYFLSTPHRWLTLLLVLTDSERRTSHPRRLVYWALSLLSLIVVVRWQADSLLCLLLIDYLWNAWHFGAQHGGIVRIYSRSLGLASWRYEAWIFRLLVPYCSLRLAGWTTGWLEEVPAAVRGVSVLDSIFVGGAWLWLVRELVRTDWRKPAKLMYASSVIGLYSSLLLALNLQQTACIATLVVASAAFHATEYLAIVSFYAQRRRESGRPGWFPWLARSWSTVLLIFLVSLAIIGYHANYRLPEIWLTVNLWVAFLHYAYDGMIWKLRDPPTAARLS